MTQLDERTDTPSPAPRRLWILVVTLSAVIIAAFAVSWWRIPEPSDSTFPPATSLVASSTTIPITQPPATAPPATTQPPGGGIDDGEAFGFLSAFDDGKFRFDQAQFLTGEDAREAAIEDGVIGQDDDLPNDFYIRDADTAPVDLPAGAGTIVVVLGFDATGGIEPVNITVDELGDVLAGTYEGREIYGVAPDAFPVTLTIADAKITGIEQVYLP